MAAGPDGNLWFTENGANRVGRITPAGAITEFSAGISSGSHPVGIVAGPDGNLWFAENGNSRVGRITTTQPPTAREFSTGITAASHPTGIALGPDGNLWFTENSGNRIGRITTAGTVREFSAGISANSLPVDIAPGADGNLWFTEGNGNRIGRITPAGVVTQFSAGISANSGLDKIVGGFDGNVWFTENKGNRIGRITAAGAVTEFSTGITAAPDGITAGPDANLWFTEVSGRIARITPAGAVTEFSAGISPGSTPRDIVLGSDSNLWFTEGTGNRIARAILDPQATTGDAASVNGVGATLTGTVNPFGAAASYAFQIGSTTAYGAVTPSSLLAARSGPTAISVNAAGLQPNTLYHYRLVATSAGGTTNGADRTFSTASSGGGLATTPDHIGPRMKIADRLLVLSSRGRVRVSVGCPLAETLGCKGTVALQAFASVSASRKRPRRLDMGRRAFTINGGQSRSISIRLSRSGRSYLRRRHAITVRVIVVATDADGNERTTVKRLRLRG
jgi:streptogramin lyase